MGKIVQNIDFFKNYYKGYLKFIFNTQQTQNYNGYKNLGILNPAIASSNLGDKIIFESVYENLREIFKADLLTEFPTQIDTSFDAIKLMREKDMLFVSGTNLLSSNLESRNQWKVNNLHRRHLKNKILLIGCGWWQYQSEVNKFTKKIYKSIFNQEIFHSVRDSYTEEKLKSIGINNVINTSCPTLWKMTPEKCAKIKETKSDEVVTTLTYYKKNVELDYKMLEILSQNYNKVHLWIQGLEDFTYFNEIKKKINNIELIPPTLEAYNTILSQKKIDYIGTRLHAGIKAIQNEKRAVILAVDNRAIEIGKNINLNVIQRESVEEITNFINSNYKTEIKLPQNNIKIWKKSVSEI